MAIAKEQLRQIIKENDLKSAGDVLFFCVDGLSGFREAIYVTSIFNYRGSITEIDREE